MERGVYEDGNSERENFVNLPKPHIKIEKPVSYGYVGSLCTILYDCM